MSMFEKFLAAIPETATSPYALLCYVALLGSFVYLTLAQYRLRLVSKQLPLLSRKDRAVLLQKEYSVEPRDGLDAEQWIRNRRTSLIFWFLFAILCFAFLFSIIVFVENRNVLKSDNETMNNMIRLWNGEIAELEEEVESLGANREVVAALKLQIARLEEKLRNPKAAVAEYEVIAERQKSELVDNSNLLDDNDRATVILALERGSTTVAKATYRRAAQIDEADAARNRFFAGELALQEANYLEAYDDFRAASVLDSDHPEYRYYLGQIAYELTRYEEAEREADEAIRLAAGPAFDRSVLRKSRRLAGDIAMLVGNYDAAHESYQALLTIYDEEGIGEDPGEYGIVLNNLAALEHEVQNYAVAERLYRKAADVILGSEGETRLVASVLNNLAYLNTQTEDFNDVDDMLFDSIRIMRKYVPDDHPEFIVNYVNLGRLYLVTRDFPKADKYLTEAERIRSASLPEEHFLFARILDIRGELDMAQGNQSDACKKFQTALGIKGKVFKKVHLENVYTLTNIVKCEPDSKSYLDEAHEICSLMKSWSDLRCTKVSELEAVWNVSQGNLDIARPILEECVLTYRKRLGVTHSETVQAERLLAGIS